MFKGGKGSGFNFSKALGGRGRGGSGLCEIKEVVEDEKAETADLERSDGK